jgi:hypothetical protein
MGPYDVKRLISFLFIFICVIYYIILSKVGGNGKPKVKTFNQKLSEVQPRGAGALL